MNMSDDLSGAVVGMSAQVAQKGVETAQHVVDKTIDNVAKLLQTLFTRNQGQVKDKDVKSSDMTDIKSGEVGIKKLVANAKKSGDTVVSTDGYSKADVKFIAKKAKEYGIPVAFVGKKNADNICAHVGGNDKVIFERICTEMMSNKLKVRPQELENFKAERWEIDGIHRELSKHDLNANWGKTKDTSARDGEYFCLYEKADRKAVLMARDEFVRKCDEVKRDLTITKADQSGSEEYGMFVLKDEKCGKEISFTDIPSRSELSAMLQEKFGYDENKAEIASAKFGEKHLDGAVKREYFGNNPQNEFSDIQNHIELKGENILVKNYDCLRVTPKADGVPCLVFRDENNNFAVLRPDKMTRKQMTAVLSETLGIDDSKTINALVDKAGRVNDFYVKQSEENFMQSYKFSDKDFDFDNPGLVANLERNDGMGNLYVKAMPVSEMSSGITRNDKDSFTVSSTVLAVETCKGEEFPKSDTRELQLSLSDKKNSLFELQKMYEGQGVPVDVAKRTARDVFAKAQAQSAEKVMHIETIKVDKQSAEAHGASQNESLESVITVRYGNQTAEFNMTDREKALTEIGEKFGVSEDEAEVLFDKAQEKISEELGSAEKDKTTDKPLNGHEKNLTPKVDVKADVPEAPKALADDARPAPKRR